MACELAKMDKPPPAMRTNLLAVVVCLAYLFVSLLLVYLWWKGFCLRVTGLITAGLMLGILQRALLYLLSPCLLLHLHLALQATY